jgi:ribosomal protein S18 acetylase RimI-like enzyme
MGEFDMTDKKALIHELEANLWETWSNFGRGRGCSLHDEGDVLWFDTPIPCVPYNGILKFQVQDNVNERIESLVNHFMDQQVTFMWIVHPTSSPSDLPQRLVERGLQEVELMPGMVRSLVDLPEPPSLPEGIELRKVIEDSDASAYYEFVAWRWHVPDGYKEQLRSVVAEFRFGEPGTRTHMWQAWEDGQPVAKAATYLAAGSAGVYAVATRPKARRRGLAGILTLTALHEARKLGKSLAVLHSSPMAESLYRSLGFEAVAPFRLFAPEEVHI